MVLGGCFDEQALRLPQRYQGLLDLSEKLIEGSLYTGGRPISVIVRDDNSFVNQPRIKEMKGIQGRAIEVKVEVHKLKTKLTR